MPCNDDYVYQLYAGIPQFPDSCPCPRPRSFTYQRYHWVYSVRPLPFRVRVRVRDILLDEGNCTYTDRSRIHHIEEKYLA
jgi:hypothetical protein